MRRPQPHQVDTEAQKIFETALPSSWICRKLDPDYGVDYQVEIVTGEHLTGLVFDVQLKGRTKVRQTANDVHFSIKTDHLCYYIDKTRAPVFLVIVDVPQKLGYWCFLQEYGLEQLKAKDWRGQDTVTIRVPCSNRMNETQQLLDAVSRADAFMTKVRPGSITGALAAQRMRLESLDRRFSVRIHAREDCCNIALNAREAVSVDLTISGVANEVRQKAQDFFGRGLPVDFAPGELKASGSALFEDAVKAPGTYQIERKRAPQP